VAILRYEAANGCRPKRLAVRNSQAFNQPEHGLFAEELSFVKRHHRRNILFNVVGESFWGLAFGLTNPLTILPVFLDQLGASAPLIGLIQTTNILGYSLPQLAAGYYTEGLPSKRLVLMYLHAGMVVPWLVLGGLLSPGGLLTRSAAMLAFFASYAVWSSTLGLLVPVWTDYVHKIVLPEFRGRFFGGIFFASTVAGIVASVAAERLLRRAAAPAGFGVCFLLAGVFITFGALMLLAQKERLFPAQRRRRTWLEYFRSLFRILRLDADLRRLALARTLLSFGNMPLGFFSIYASQTLGVGARYAGVFTAIILAAQMPSYLLFGYLGDRKGHKVVACASGLAVMMALVIALFARSFAGFALLFGLVGVFSATFYMSHTNMVLELCPHRDKTSYVAIANVVPAAPAAVAPLLGGYLVQKVSYLPMFAVASVPLAIGLIVLIFFVGEPRRRSKSSA